ncbi:low affinity potassium transporter [Diatrype stigma]|uniref:Potassium transport protein n=1 Tax=Diatrype stigma TaxID=117547 RepID=A0AAN9YQG4_9PEZI
MKDPREIALGVIQWIRPSFLSRDPHFNFITVHYFWILGWSIVGSILIYATARGQLEYIDALFFASGANTQAGLNTVDTNTLNLFAQIVIYLMAMISSPITIHGFVVFLRLYWFEKRFQHIVKEATQRRVSISKSRSKAKTTAADVERGGVNGRHITVMYNTAKASRMTNDGTLLDGELMNVDSDVGPDQATNGTRSKGEVDPNGGNHPVRPGPPQIKFSDQVKRSSALDDEDDVPLPQRRSDAEHIAILERQRKGNKSVLRIPGPRDVERGVRPEEFDEDEETQGPPNLTRKESNTYSLRGIISNRDRPQTTITIEEPPRPRRDETSRPEEIAEDIEAAAHTVSPMKFRKNKVQGEKLEMAETGASTATHHINPLRRLKTALTQSKDHDPMPYLSYQPTIGRNSTFLGLTEEEREELGGIEYRSLKTLAVVLLVYFWGYSIFGIICFVPWILNNNEFYTQIVGAAGVNSTWWAFFTANSAFMDLGLTLTPDSMISFNSAIFPLLVMSFLIILGNTGFPIMLRFMIWLASIIAPRGSGLWEELKFLLDHPRRCFTLLFPSNATWWLFLVLVLLNGLDLLLFIVLDLHSEAVEQLPLNIRFLDGWFQATATRTAGFACVNLANLHPAIQVSYLVMMYISVFPIAISIRSTNVYEEKSLGVYKPPEEVDDENPSGMAYLGSHLRRQLSFDLWYVFIGFFILSISEGPRLASGDLSMFAVLFEIVSAYGTVGLSLGYATVNASLCSQFSVVGKLVIIAMMIRGRHRGLPYGLDRAVLLPSEHLNRREAEEAELRLQRRDSAMTAATATATGGGARDRAASLVRGRSHSVDRRHVLTNLLHPGPVFPASSMAKSTAKSEQSLNFGYSETLRKYKSNPEEEDDSSKANSNLHLPTPPRPQQRRSTAQPIYDY